MKWLFSLLLFSVPAFADQAAITDFKGGLNSNYSSITIGDNEVQDSLNVYFDKDNAAVKREGFSVCGSSKSYSFDSAWTYSDSGNSNYLIVRSSDAIVASNNGCDFNVLIATVNANLVVNEVNALGKAWFVDRERGVYFWNGTSTTYVSNSPLGQYIAEFRERVCVSGIAHPSGNDLYCSAYLDGSDWDTSSTLDTGAILVRVGLNDAYDNITALFSGYSDSLLIWKNKSMYGMYGFDKSDFVIRILTREAGCTDQRGIQPFMGGIVFPSARGIEFFNGVQVLTPPISDKVKDKIRASTLSTFNEASWTQSSQSDFEAGASTPTNYLSFSQSPGSVIPALSSQTDTTDSDFTLAESTSGCLIKNNAVVISTNTVGSVQDNDFETGFIWTQGSRWIRIAPGTLSTDNCGSMGADSGTDFMYFSGDTAIPETTQLTAEIIDANDDSALLSTNLTWSSSNCSYNTATITGNNSYARKEVKIRLYGDHPSANYLTSLPFIYSGENITFRWASDLKASSGARYFIIDNFSGGRVTGTTCDFYSRAFDTGKESSYIAAESSITVNEAPLAAFHVDIASSPYGSWFQDILTSTGTSAFANKRYVRYRARIAYTVGYDMLTSINEVSLLSRSTGTYYSAVHNAPNLTSWSTLVVNKDDNDGSHTFYMRSSADPFTVASSTPSWSAQSANTVISISTGTYFQLRDDFSITHDTQTPSLNLFTISWNEGTPASPMASITDDKHYYLSLSTTSEASENTGTLVLSPGPVWSMWDLKAGAFVNHKGTIYHTNNSGNGNVYTDFIGTDDAGSAINAYIKTKDYSFGDITKDKLFDSFYIVTDPSNGSDIDTQYFVNRSTTPYSLHSLDLTSTDGILSERLNFPIDSSHPNFGKTVSFKLSNDDLDEPMKIYGGIFNFRIRRTE